MLRLYKKNCCWCVTNNKSHYYTFTSSLKGGNRRLRSPKKALPSNSVKKGATLTGRHSRNAVAEEEIDSEHCVHTHDKLNLAIVLRVRKKM